MIYYALFLISNKKVRIGAIMFYYISGSLALKGDGFAVIDACGIGYKLTCSLYSLEKLDNVGSEVKMYTYMYLREDICDLYGFVSQEEQNMFMLLIGVSGVGPKAALSILSTMTPSNLALAIVSGDTKSITRAQGVGPKVAQRVILELKDKIKNEDMLPSGNGNVFDSEPVSFGASNEAVEALCVLGYSSTEAKKALSGIDMSMDLELIIKEALKKLMR